ncbi:hypothetical protein C8N35_101583 [Breoghania corrubedonensis]|uniref:Uncharacterized protein n=1 Tax=Breoghania corrubedonensis TaxID=665038 RepID=A0A2T5VFL1_9HYPH|nr:hypothetical protein C8N35_101583 [Breoghania corrubedonensis]
MSSETLTMALMSGRKVSVQEQPLATCGSVGI